MPTVGGWDQNQPFHAVSKQMSDWFCRAKSEYFGYGGFTEFLIILRERGRLCSSFVVLNKHTNF